MTQQEFDQLIPRKSVLRTEIDGKQTEVLLKFFLCSKEDYDGYWMLVTTDFSNPEPTKILPTDYEVCFNQAEVVKIK